MPRNGSTITKITQSALAHPLMSSLRKMSPKMAISIQIQMTKRKNSSIVHNRPCCG